MEKEEKPKKEPRKVSTKLAVGAISGTVAVIVVGCGITYLALAKRLEDYSPQEMQANYAVSNMLTNSVTEDNNNISTSENEMVNEVTNTVEEIEQEEEEKQEDTTEKKNENKTTKKKEEVAKKEETKTPSKQETTKKEETPVKNEPTVVDTTEEKKLTKTETKYGIVTNTYTVTTYNIYSDGSKKEKSTKTETEKDGKYSATTAELLPEAKQLKSQNASLINGVLEYVNQYRKEVNVTDIVLDSKLTELACARTIEMAYDTGMSHTRPNGSSCFTILKEGGVSYYTCGENVAAGQRSAKSVANSWRNSEGHYKNMIKEAYGKIGIGVIKHNGNYYWCQLFTN